MLKEFFERRRVKRVFSKVVDRNLVEALIESWGVFTCSKLARFGFAIPAFDAVLCQLASLRFGEAKLFTR